MKKLIFVLCLAAIFPARLSWAQLAAPNDTGVAMGHIHLVVRDLDAYKKFWLAMGGTPGELGANLSFKFPGVLIFVRKGEPSGGTVGSVVNHFGFQVPDTKAALARWTAAGLKTEVGQNPGQGFVFTPDDLSRIEILEDKSLTVPIVGHHVHFYVANVGGAMRMWRCHWRR